jgi:hypothetical protein
MWGCSVLEEFMEQFSNSHSCVCERALSPGCGAIHPAMPTGGQFTSTPYVAGLLHSVQNRVKRSGTQLVAMSLQLSDDPHAEDWFLRSVMKNMKVDQPGVEKGCSHRRTISKYDIGYHKIIGLAGPAPSSTPQLHCLREVRSPSPRIESTRRLHLTPSIERTNPRSSGMGRRCQPPPACLRLFGFLCSFGFIPHASITTSAFSALLREQHSAKRNPRSSSSAAVLAE